MWRWRRVPLRVLDSIPIFAAAWGITVAFMAALGNWAAIPAIPEMGYMLYCLHRIAAHDNKPAYVPIPWASNTRYAAPVEPSRTPRMWPPQPGYCYICGIHDPEREQTLGTAVHPTCAEWLGDWRPEGFVTGDQVRMLTPPPAPGYTETLGTRMEQIDNRIGKLRQSIRESDARLADTFNPLPLAIPGFQYSWTCKCPPCKTHWGQLQQWDCGHPKDCHCTNCRWVQRQLEQGRAQLGPHHRNCYCTQCHLNTLDALPMPIVHDAWITVPGRPDVKIPCPCGYHAAQHRATSGLPPFEPGPRLTQRTSE